jgi:hypothetical protein
MMKSARMMTISAYLKQKARGPSRKDKMALTPTLKALIIIIS